MLKRFLPAQNNFFILFEQLADIVVDAAVQFHAMLLDLENQQKYVDIIAAHEKAGDQISHNTFSLLHKTFITPFDRHDIHNLTTGLDDILDLINRCAQRFPYYQLKTVPDEIIKLAEISKQSSSLLKDTVFRLHSLKQTDKIFQLCQEIDANESKAHQFVIAGEKKLFLEEMDFKQFFKLKEIYAQTKLTINSCQDAANTIKGIILEYS